MSFFMLAFFRLDVMFPKSTVIRGRAQMTSPHFMEFSTHRLFLKRLNMSWFPKFLRCDPLPAITTFRQILQDTSLSSKVWRHLWVAPKLWMCDHSPWFFKRWLLRKICSTTRNRNTTALHFDRKINDELVNHACTMWNPNYEHTVSIKNFVKKTNRQQN